VTQGPSGGTRRRAAVRASGHEPHNPTISVDRRQKKALGGDTQGPPGWEPDLRWRGWGAEFHLRRELYLNERVRGHRG